jgi:sugar lactone lactonase YvrE
MSNSLLLVRGLAWAASIVFALTGFLRVDAPIVVSGFSTPESAIHDEVADVYLVSNINGGPGAFDNNGFISRVAPGGTILQLAWIRGGVGGVTLNAPKGMVIRDDVLYVSDIDTVRAFDRVTGAPVGAFAVPNPFAPRTLFLNDVAVAPNGTLYVTDNVNGAIFKIDITGNVSLFASGPDLCAPNGVLADGANNVSWVTFQANEIRRTTPSGHVFTVAKIPAPSVAGLGLPPNTLRLDGYLRLPDGWRIVTSWVTGAVYRISPSGHSIETVVSFTGLLQNPAAPSGPADVGFDDTRQRLLIPLFVENKLVIQPLE